MTPAFRDWVERARSEHVGAVLNRRQINLPGRGNRRAGPCPKCGGEDRFAVDLEKEVFNCRGCGGKGHGSISLVEFLDGVNFLQAVETITGEPPPKDAPKDKPLRAKKPRGRLVCTYDYTDELDVEQYQVCRYAEPKSFSQRRPDPDHQGEWISDLNGVRLVPYHLSDLMEGIANGHPVYWVEGEKDAENGAKLGLVTTTTAMGLAGKGHWERGVYDEFFRGACVILVPDQDADPKKGGELARVIARRLKPIADVWLLNLPAKDLSDWIDAGGTREALDAMPLERPVEMNGNGHDEEYELHWEPPGTAQPAMPTPVPVPTVRPFPIDGASIPRRPWIVPGLLLRRHVSVLVAPPGSGKSLLTLQIALMMGTGVAWGGWHPRGAAKTLIINSEDDNDEMRRRLYAGAKIMNCDEAALAERIELADAPESIVIARADAKTKTVVRTPVVESIVATILAGGFDVVVIDPFAECFEGDENSNSELKWAALLWREIARRTNCAVLLVHHTRKYANEPGDMDAARGAGALLGVARVVSTVFTMSQNEAQAFDIDPERRHEYLRFDDAKANLSLVTFKARWFFKRTFTLPNGTEDEPADQLGVLEPWVPATVFDKFDAGIARTVLLAIDAGVMLDGQPTGDLFAPTRRGKVAPRWAGNVVMDHIACSEKEAQKLINTWLKSRVLTEVEIETSTSKGRKRKGLKVNMARMPGNITDEVSL